MGLQTKDLRGWLEAQAPDEKFFTGPELPKYPRRCVLLTRSQGGGLEMEFALDNPSWQVQVVGPQSRDGRVNTASEQAEELMMMVDTFILSARWPQTIGTTRVVSAQPFGSGPSPLPVDLAGRTHFTATYVFRAPSGYA
jgi:hypothetical protein